MSRPATDNYFGEQIAVIDAVLKMLNSAELPEDKLGGFHIRVALCDGDGRKVGFFSDEIGPNCWYYQPEISGDQS